MIKLGENVGHHQTYYSSSWGEHEQQLQQMSQKSIQNLLRHLVQNHKFQPDGGARRQVKE